MQNRVAGAAQGWALVFLSGLPAMAIVSLVPNLPQLFQRFGQLPHAGLLVPMVLTIPSLCIALLSTAIGALSDRIGRRPVLLVSLAIFMTVGLLPVFMNDLTAVLLTRLPVGIAEAGIIATQNAMLGDYFEGQARERWLGVVSLVNPILAGAFVLAGGVLGAASWHLPFLLYLVGLPMLIWSFVSLFEPARQGAAAGAGAAVARGFPWKTSALVALVTLGVSVLYYVQAVQLGRIFGEHGIADPARIGLYVTLASVGVMLGGALYPKLAKAAFAFQFAAVLLSYALGYVGLGLAGSIATALAAAVVAQFGNGLGIPVMIGWALSRFDAQDRGSGMGTWAAGFFAGTFLSPPFVSLIQHYTGSFLSAVAGVGVICAAVALVLGGLASRQTQG